MAMTQEQKVINFMGPRRFASWLSIILVLASLVSLGMNGRKLGLDFTGGTQIEVGFDQPADIPKIRSILVDEGLSNPMAVLFGSESEVLIRTQGSMQDGGLIGINRALESFGDEVEVKEIGRAPREQESFSQLLLVGNISPAQLREAKLFPASYYGNSEYSAVGSDTQVLIEKSLDIAYTAQLLEILTQETGASVELRRSEFVGPQIGEELRDQGGLGILCALLVVMLYVAVRFQYKFSVAAVVALMHDVIIVLGVFSIFQHDFDLTVLAAVLAVIGYSINDTIVVFDRIRDNFRTLRKSPADEVINISLSQMLERTLLTSLTTMLTLVMLYLFGGELINGFAFALLVGIGVGTYSSVYIAANILMAMNITKEDLLPPVKEGAELDEAP
jgi:preprotein translocase subunit SecF